MTVKVSWGDEVKWHQAFIQNGCNSVVSYVLSSMDSINVSQIEIIEVECVCVLFSVCELTSKPHHRSSWGVPLARYTSHIKLTTSSKKLLFLLECCFLFDPYCFCLPAHPSKSPLLIGSSPANCYGQATSWPCSVVKKCYKKTIHFHWIQRVI